MGLLLYIVNGCTAGIPWAYSREKEGKLGHHQQWWWWWWPLQLPWEKQHNGVGARKTVCAVEMALGDMLHSVLGRAITKP